MAGEEFPFRFVPPVDPNIGRRVDQYFILRMLLGRGGMGAAYLAEHEARAHVKCVVKLILAELARHPLAISRYRTETEAVSLLKHDNIVKLQNFGVLEDGQLFMRFEYIDGKSLDRHTADRGGRLSLREAAYLIFQLTDALDYAHRCGVIHRDLKPDNVMIELNPPGSHLTERVKILDFGIAKVVASTTEHTGSGVSMGTPRFMAPEQVTNAAAATGHADVFSLAVIFYLLVTGTLPWGTPESDIAIYHKQQTEAPARPPEDVMPRRVAALVLRALSLVPEGRPTMHEFAIELARAIPAEDGLQSGIEILKDVKRTWVTSSPPPAQTLRPIAIDPTSLPAGRPLPGDAETRSPDGFPSALVPRPASPAPAPRSSVTANARPRALAGSPAPPAGSVPDSPALMPATRVGTPEPSPSTSAAVPAARRSRRSPAPLLAALPTGLISQRFAAQTGAFEIGRPSIVVASELEMAAGTPGPQPYAHAELPAVLVSSTQLSELPRQASAPSPPPLAPLEPAPMLVLPGAPRALAARSKLLLVGSGLVVLAAVAGAVLLRGGSQSDARVASEAPQGRAASVVPSGANDAGPPLPVEATGSDAGGAAVRPGGAAPDHVARPAIARPSATEVSTHRVASSDSRPPAPAVVVAHPADMARAPSSAQPPSTQSAPPRANGELAIIVKPWATIWLNGRALSDGTPYRAQVPAGRYRIRIANDDLGKTEAVTVTVEPRKTTIVERTWQ